MTTDIRPEVVESEDDGDLSKCYKILGVSTEATSSDLRQAYRQLALENHPDKGGDIELFYRINKAYAILKQEAQDDKTV